MRLSKFRELSPSEQKEEVKKALIEIAEAGKELDRLGKWTIPTWKQLREASEPITIWERKQGNHEK